MNANENEPLDDNFYFEKEKREFQEAKERREIREGKRQVGVNNVAANNDTISGEHCSELDEEHLRHEDHHVNRKYKMFTTHDSSHDQPRTNTGPGTV